ncbi:hypothetical protein AQUCO_00200812v1 [Aquilegia coerulea]|uniref:Glycosyltransferase n=1 Tax=Aquilegia coerulea TaxID=218851 RepID=A0A2G5F508_AQUCA|nr:hypothetical protein AQUCO_00200812v1 [Aquilegia coerulea]
MARPHLLVVPYPAQGHVMPLMELSHNLVDRGFKITFVNTESIHNRVVASMSNSGDIYEDFIHLVSLPDGLEAEEDRNDLGKLSRSIIDVMPGPLEELIKKINETNNGEDRITCVIADQNQGWVLEVANKMSIKRAVVWPASAAALAAILHIPKLIEEGILDEDGIPIENQMIHLSPTMPAMNTAHFVWLCMGDLAMQKAIFKLLIINTPTIKFADYLLCNSCDELEPSAFTLIPNLKHIGPLFASSRLAQLWPEDSTCLSWLDQQPARSVIYVAFGSFTVMDKQQFGELALGLEQSGQPFLWVVRPDLTGDHTDVYPDGFEERVRSRGRMVGWAPQREVLAHPSVACFLTHCGWNSTMEGLTVGVPLLCWPYFADQMLNKSYICDIWKIGLGLDTNENGLISKEEIKTKVLGLLADEGIKENALKWKEIAKNSVSDGGTSSRNFDDFAEAIK